MAGKKPAEGIELDVKPTSQLDLERRLSEGDPEPVLFKTVNPDESALHNENEWNDDSDNLFIGTDPIYQARANETDQPLQAEEGPDKDAEDAFLASYETPSEVSQPLADRYGEVNTNTLTGGSTSQAAQTDTSASNNESDGAASDTAKEGTSGATSSSSTN